MSAIANLDSILDSIDTRKRKLQQEETSSSSSSSSKSSVAYKDPLASFCWTKHFDRSSNNYYYHNSRTNVTQWEVPDDFVEEDQLHTHVQRRSDEAQEATALFFTKMPASSTSTSSSTFALGNNLGYWEAMGREPDKAGRQLGAYFDLRTLEENRAKAAEMKLARQQGKDKSLKGKSTQDWNDYKKEKKKKKLLHWSNTF